MKILKNISNLIVLSIILLFISQSFAAAAKKDSVIYDENNTNIELKKKKTFTIKLKSNATTGYEWDFAEMLDTTKLELVRSEYKVYPSNKKMVGSGGEQIFKFKTKAKAKGKTTIKLKYWRNWEKEADKVIEFKVNIE